MDFNAPNTEHEAVYIEFIGKTISTLLLDHSDSHWKTAWPLDCKFSNDEKQKVLTWRNTLLKQIKSCIDNNLYSVKLNVIDPTKDNFSEGLSINWILHESKISKDEHYRVLPMSKDEYLELYLKRFFDIGLKAWYANMDIQPVFNDYKTVTYLSIFLQKWRSMFTSNETSRQGRLWEQHASSWHHNNNS